MRRRTFFWLIATALLAIPSFCTSPKPNLSGLWKQSNERCVPARTGDVTRRIDQHGTELLVETTSLRAAGPARHAVQRYSTDGSTSVSTGADGDEFHTSIRWRENSLVFSIEEHEDGRILHTREVWTLNEGGSVLKIEREALDGEGHGPPVQMLLYTRQLTDASRH